MGGGGGAIYVVVYMSTGSLLDSHHVKYFVLVTRQ